MFEKSCRKIREKLWKHLLECNQETGTITMETMMWLINQLLNWSMERPYPYARLLYHSANKMMQNGMDMIETLLDDFLQSSGNGIK
jgi:hypothetical protein